MTDQQTEVNHDQQYAPHGNGHPEPLHAEPAATYGIHPPAQVPHPHAPRWPLGAKLTVGVLVAVLAAVLALSLVTIKSVSDRQSGTDRKVSQLSQAVGLNASQASQDNSATGGSVASLRSQVSTLRAQLGAIATAVSHHGLCVSFSRNTGNGDLVDVNLTTPTVTGGSYNCGQGTLVSVVPAP